MGPMGRMRAVRDAASTGAVRLRQCELVDRRVLFVFVAGDGARAFQDRLNERVRGCWSLGEQGCRGDRDSSYLLEQQPPKATDRIIAVSHRANDATLPGGAESGRWYRRSRTTLETGLRPPPPAAS